MRNFLNPKWLFFINTLPIVVVIFLSIGQYNIINSLLDDNTIYLWKTFGLTLLILGILNYIYAVYLTLKKQNVSVWYGIIALICYISYIYVYAYHLNRIIPATIPRWMITENVFIYVGTFLMPTLAYSLFILIEHFTPESKEHKAWVSFLTAISIPVAGYMFSQIIFPLWKPVDSEFIHHVLFIIVIAATLVFLFFLVRSIFILAAKKSEVWQKYQLVWKIIIALVLPIIGLLVNNGHLFRGAGEFPHDRTNIFGDFNNHWFYILAVFNGVLICLPDLENKIYRLIIFIGRSITFTFTLYFFLVFLPFLPLSVIAIIVVGTGFLMLSPLLIFVIHIKQLSVDFKYLRNHFSKKYIIGFSILSFLVIPSFITVNYLKDRSVLNETLAYLFSPDYSKNYSIDKTSLENTLNVINYHKDSDNGRIISGQIPYLSSYFNWLVLDNFTLSDKKINFIQRIFFGKSLMKTLPEINFNNHVEITNIKSNSIYDKSQNVWKSWVDLEIMNTNESNWISEYTSTFDLPEGCWISDYYLYIGNKKEYGILAEKKSAMWVYSNIRDEDKRDPGILHYLTGNKVSLKIFPFSRNEVRKTGIQFLHKEPVKIMIDNNIVELGNEKETNYEKIETENIVYISSQQKKNLKLVKRKPYFHFIVDISKNKEKFSSDFKKRIDKVLESYKPLAENAQISFVNSYVNTYPISKDWKLKFQSQTFEGGFYLERAINKALFSSYRSKSYPVIIVVTDSIQNAVLENDFSDFKFAFPENDLFYNLRDNETLQEHSLTKNPSEPQPDVMRECMFCETVLEYKLSDGTFVYLPNNNQPDIILKNSIFNSEETEIKEKDWKSALIMQGKWISQILHPETSDKEWLNLVKFSFISKVMTPVTSFLVVENEAQKAILKKKQEQVLSAIKSLDLEVEPQRMSEPDLWIMTLLFGIVIFLGQKRIRQLRK